MIANLSGGRVGKVFIVSHHSGDSAADDDQFYYIEAVFTSEAEAEKARQFLRDTDHNGIRDYGWSVEEFTLWEDSVGFKRWVRFRRHMRDIWYRAVERREKFWKIHPG